MKTICVAAVSAFLSVLCTTANGQITWSENVAPILYSHCTKCHHEGGIGPFSLITYDDIEGGEATILEAITTSFMPPWPADPNYQHFAFENVLSAEEIQTISDWVEQGAPEGNPDLAPTPPVYSENSVLPSIDFTGQTGEYTSTAVDEDMFRTFVIPAGVSIDTFIDAIEIIPGNAEIVHHVLIYYDPTTDCLDFDAADPGPGFATDGTGGGLPEEVKTLGVWVPGNSPSVLPEGFAFKIEANGYYLVEIHMPEDTDGEVDNTTINVHYSDSDNPRQVFMDPILYHFPPVLEEPFLYIPANDTATFHESYTLPIGVTIFNIFPHMHLIGRTITSWGETNDEEIIPFIHINDWDFHWQYTYSYPSLLYAPTSTEIKASAFYDNTANNPHQPNDPPQVVFGGEETSDEMMVVFFTYTLHLPGDENIVVDPALGVSEQIDNSISFNVSPNPANESAWLNTFSDRHTMATFVVTDMQGRSVGTQSLTLQAGLNKTAIDFRSLASGMYVLTLITEGSAKCTRLVKN